MISCFFLISYSFVLSRGVLELFIDKKYAYIIQASIWILFIIYIHINSKFQCKNTSLFRLKLLAIILFIFSIIISSSLTFFIKGFDYFWIYSFVSIYLCILLFSSTTVNYEIVNKINFTIPISILTLLIVIVGLFEQLLIIDMMPGSWIFFDFVRPASTLGSMQHYAITLAILSFAHLEFYKTTNNISFIIISIIAMFGSIASFTRSGSMIICFALLFYVIASCVKVIKKLTISKFDLLTFLLLFTILSSSFIFFYDNVLIDRIISSIDLQEAGNTIRVKSWNKGLNSWLDSNIIFGVSTGYVTNATNRLGTISSGVVESGFIQQLVNFGLIGCLSFYLLLIIQFLEVNNKHLFIKSVMVAAIFETLIYQSIETLPFMVTFSILPLLSSNLLYMKCRQ